MIKNLMTVPDHSHSEIASERVVQTGRFSWLKPRVAIILGLVLLGIILAVFFSGRLSASQDQVAIAAQPQDNLLSARAYQFTGQGKILGGSGAIWMIGGVPIMVSDHSQIDNGIHPGDTVSVLGQITKDGKWLADSINPISDQDSFFSFGGPVSQRTQTSWEVAGISLLVNNQTQLGISIQDNDLVVATFKVMPDQTWLALKIESLSTLSAQGTLTPTPTVATPEPTTDQKQIVTNQKPPAINPAGKSDNPSGCYKSNGKGKGNNGKCTGSGGESDDNEGGD